MTSMASSPSNWRWRTLSETRQRALLHRCISALLIISIIQTVIIVFQFSHENKVLKRASVSIKRLDRKANPELRAVSACTVDCSVL